MLDNITMKSAELTISFITNDDNITLLVICLELGHTVLHSSGNEGVDTTTKILVCGDRDNEGLLWELLKGGILNKSELAVEGCSQQVEGDSCGKMLFVSLKFCCRNHLH
eukprot:1645137-Ditylum_brightwellii.AAC.1